MSKRRSQKQYLWPTRTVFWDSEGCILADFLEKGEKINAARYVQTLDKLRRTLREKRQKKKTVILRHEKSRPHTARLTLQTFQKNGWELLSHPPYSLDFAPSDYHLFGPFKDPLRGHHYETDEAVQEAGCEELEPTSTAEESLGYQKAIRIA
jgi:histone-lysine N-methyltransferase SETMAR